MAFIGAVDYVIFSLFLCLSLSVGIYHAWRAKRHRSGATSHFLMGSRKMPVGPTALSLLTTFLSGGTLLGGPPEIYKTGVLFWVFYMFGSFSFILSAIFFVPVIFKLQPTSVYEYFEKRFDSRLLRSVAAVLFLTNTIFYMSVVMYAPAVALAEVTGEPDWPFILVIGLASTFYTSIGGLKAVVWTDTIQAVFMYAGVTVLIVKGTMDAGGFSHVWELSTKLGRIEEPFSLINPSPAQYHSVWIVTFGSVAYWTTMYGLNQMSLQRYCSLRSVSDMQLVVAITVPAFCVLSTMALFIGLVALAYFHGCDPLSTRRVDTPDKLTMLFAAHVLGDYPGLVGLFLACLFSATLSTLSSGMNSMAAVTWEDLIKHHVRLSDTRATALNKALVVLFGMSSTGLAFACDALGGIVYTCTSVFGAISGPLVGLIILGILVPRSNRLSALVAFGLSEVFMLWICIGNFIYQPYRNYALDTNSTCPSNNSVFKSAELHFGEPDVFVLYKISPWAYALIGILCVFVVGLIVSAVTPDKWDKNRERHRPLTYIGRNLDWIDDHDSMHELQDK